MIVTSGIDIYDVQPLLSFCSRPRFLRIFFDGPRFIIPVLYVCINAITWWCASFFFNRPDDYANEYLGTDVFDSYGVVLSEQPSFVLVAYDGNGRLRFQNSFGLLIMTLSLISFPTGTCLSTFAVYPAVDIIIMIYIASYYSKAMRALAGYPLGLLTYFGVGAAEQTYIMLSVFAFVTVSIIGLFENRFYILTVDSRRWRQKRKFLYFLNHVAALVCFLISYLKVPDQKVAFEFMQQFVSCIPPYADKNRIFIYTTYLRYVLIPGCVCFILFFAQLLAFPMMTNQILKKQLYKNMSDNTANLQRTFQRALVFQVALPVIILAFPVCYLGLAAQLWYHNQALNNVSFIIISSHGFFSAISMISLHAAYRDFTLTFFCYRRGSSYKLDVPTAQHIRPSIIT
ncbi:unnamed protein product [Caenorhabditis brenneri]